MKYVKTFEQYLTEHISYVVGDVVVLNDGTIGRIVDAKGNLFKLKMDKTNQERTVKYGEIDQMYYANNTPADALQNDMVKRTVTKISNDIMVHNYPNNPMFYGM